MSYNTYPQNPFPPNSENVGGGALPSDVITQDDIALPFNENSAYSAGDFCYYNNTLYRFEVDHDGAWNASDAFAVRVCDSIISEFGDGLIRTGAASVAVKLEQDGGLSFGQNGGLQAETNFNANTYPSNGNSTQIGRIIVGGSEYPVYRKCFTDITLPNNTTLNIPSGLTNEHIIKLYGTAINNSGSVAVLPYVSPSQISWAIDLGYSITSHNIQIATLIDYSNFTGMAVIEYYLTT